MKRTLLSLLLTLMITFPVYAHNRAQVIANGTQSLVQLVQGDGDGPKHLCTGFVVNQLRGLILTAVHCVNGEGAVRIDTAEVKVVKTSDTLALVQTQQTIGPSLEIRKPELNMGDEVISLGFGFGYFTALVRHVSDPHAHYDLNSKDQDDIIMDGAVAPGMSGGPVLDEDGRVVGVNQQNSPNFILSLACGQKEIKAFLKGA